MINFIFVFVVFRTLDGYIYIANGNCVHVYLRLGGYTRYSRSQERGKYKNLTYFKTYMTTNVVCCLIYSTGLYLLTKIIEDPVEITK